MADEPQGQQSLYDDTNEFNVTSFLIAQALSLIAGSTLVQVVACTKNDQVGPIGTVDVQPLVNMLDGAGKAQAHGVLYKLTYCRVQGGRDAVICDPVKGDIGVAVFASRDISSVKKNQKRSNPGTLRQNSYSDGMYLFTAITPEAPLQWVRFVRNDDGTPKGIEIVDVNGNKIEMLDTGVKLTDLNDQVIEMKEGSIAMTTDLLSVTGAVKAGFGGADEVGLQTHTHKGVTTGSGHSGTPDAGT